MPETPAIGPETAPEIGKVDTARPYRVLARTHRPQRLSELIGQEALVRTLTNALATGRVAHAFLLTGIRGVGKTTTARIIARALNCIGPDGLGGPTPEPCGVCSPCVAIAEGRHMDVLEMDAATRTGIDDIRELVESVRYAPTSARYKVYVVDEVHMLSQQAFNGLLKTLEEPPPQTIFIFATTEVRKVPLTVLSRCQRFDLRRVEGPLLETHLARIAAVEAVAIEPPALALIARAAEGSVRDGVSLLDQAMALGGGAAIDAQQVQDMLGLADRALVLDLFERLMAGDVAQALDRLAGLYDLGTEPEAVVRDLLEISHWLTRLQLAPEAPAGFAIAEATLARGQALAGQLSLPVLARTWQMLLKGLDDLSLAPSPLQAAEMLLVRIAYAADLPPPAELARQLGGAAAAAAPAGAASGSAWGAATPPPSPAARSLAEVARPAPPAPSVVTATQAPPPEPEVPPEPEPPAPIPPARPTSFAEAVELFRQRGEPMLHGWLHESAQPVHFETGRIEIKLAPGTPRDLPGRVAEALGRWTGRTWLVSLAAADTDAEPTLGDQARAQRQARLEALAHDPRLKPVLEQFGGATIVDVRPLDIPDQDVPADQADPPDQTAEQS